MAERLKSHAALALVALLALAAGYALPRPSRPGDMFDAVACVQRRSPRFLITEPAPPAGWVRSGAVYLCRAPMTAVEVESLNKGPGRGGPDWVGVVCFRGTADASVHYVPWVADGGDRCLRYGGFAVYGDPELLREVRDILADAGYRPAS